MHYRGPTAELPPDPFSFTRSRVLADGWRTSTIIFKYCYTNGVYYHWQYSDWSLCCDINPLDHLTSQWWCVLDLFSLSVAFSDPRERSSLPTLYIRSIVGTLVNCNWGVIHQRLVWKNFGVVEIYNIVTLGERKYMCVRNNSTLFANPLTLRGGQINPYYFN